MEVTDNKTENPLKYYRSKAAEADPAELSLKSCVPFEGEGFHFTIMGRPVCLRWPDLTARYEDDGKETASAFVILMCRVAMFGTLTEGTGKMLSYMEVPWGAHYFKAFKGRCLDRLSRTYGQNAKKLAQDAAAIGAKVGVHGGRDRRCGDGGGARSLGDSTVASAFDRGT